MIYFNKDLIKSVLELAKDAHDCADVLKDLARINDAIASIQNFDGLGQARELDKELRDKYPCIDVMLGIAQAMSSGFSGQTQSSSYSLPEISNLSQDYHGIICGTAVKKGIVHEIKDMIERVD